MRPTVTVFTRRGCKLCEQAEAAAADLSALATVELVDVDADPLITEQYTVRVPVVAVDGVELFELSVDPTALREAVAEAAAR